MKPLMISSEKLKQVVTGHRRTLIVGLCLVVVVVIAIAVIFIARAVHHHQRPTPVPTLSLTSFDNSTSPSAAGWSFSILFSDPINGSLYVTPQFRSFSSSNHSSPAAIIQGKSQILQPKGSQAAFSGLIPLADLPLIFQEQPISDTLRPALHVSMMLDGVFHDWLCYARPAGKCFHLN